LKFTLTPSLSPDPWPGRPIGERERERGAKIMRRKILPSDHPCHTSMIYFLSSKLEIRST